MVVNAVQGNIHSWGQGFSYFGVGAAGTWAGLYAGPVVSGLIFGAGNNFVTQGFGSSGSWNWNNIHYDQVAISGLMGAGIGFLGSQVSSSISPYVSKLFSGIGGQAVQQGLTQSVVGAGTGFTLSTAMALANGESLGDALKEGGKGAALGGMSGLVSGISSGMRSAYKAGENPLTGNETISKSVQNNFKEHAFANDRHNDLNLNKEQIVEKSNELIMNNRYKYTEGDNTMTGKINGIEKSYKVYIQNGTIKSINMYPGVSNRITTGNVIRYGNLNW